MPTDTATKVTAAHLSRQALLYIRQSTLKQVIHNTESAHRQYDSRGKATALGWDAERVRVIDVERRRAFLNPPLPAPLPVEDPDVLDEVGADRPPTRVGNLLTEDPRATLNRLRGTP